MAERATGCPTGPLATACPQCGITAEGVRCPRCDALKLQACSGACSLCKTRKADGRSRPSA